MLQIFLETTGGNLLLGYIPEPIGLLMFALTLIGLAVGLRRFFDRGVEINEK